VSDHELSAPAGGLFSGLRWRKAVLPVAAALVLAAVLLAASRLGWLPEAPDRFTYDWRTTLLAERAPQQRDDIAIVLIDEESLTGYPYLSPIDRGLSAELVRSIDSAGPKAIGLDFIIDRPTEPIKDAAFAEAVRTAKAPVIIGAVDERGGPRPPEVAYQADFLTKTGAKGGHIYFATEPNRLTLGDQAVRFIVPPSPVPPSRPSFTRLLAEVDGTKPEPATDLINWRLPPSQGGADLFLTFSVPAHHDPSGKRTGPILPESWRAALAGKIVLVGGSFSDRDRHLTPLTVASGERISGVKIHAQILAQLRDGRSLYTLTWPVEFLVVALVAGFGFFAARRWTLKGDGWRASSIAFVFVLVLGLFLFWAFRVILPSGTLFLAWPLGLLAGNRADWALDHVRRMTGGRLPLMGS
jgi:CHASE2 domain-containing sensor protein